MLQSANSNKKIRNCTPLKIALRHTRTKRIAQLRLFSREHLLPSSAPLRKGKGQCARPLAPPCSGIAEYHMLSYKWFWWVVILALQRQCVRLIQWFCNYTSWCKDWCFHLHFKHLRSYLCEMIWFEEFRPVSYGIFTPLQIYSPVKIPYGIFTPFMLFLYSLLLHFYYAY